MREKSVLDAGCGSGGFAEIALSTGAYVIALDYSSAVDACWADLKHHSNLHVVQGDIYALPFVPGSFDFVYSLGALQHSPDVARAFAALPRMLVPGGRICVDYYEKSFKKWLHPKYWLRPFTRRFGKERMFGLLNTSVPGMLAIITRLLRVPVIGKILKRLVPVANYEGVYPLREAELQERALLDTFDWLSPAYDRPQTAKTARRWMVEAGLAEVEILRAGHLVGRSLKNAGTCKQRPSKGDAE